MDKGYKVLEIFEVYEYDVTQYEPQTGHGGIFVGYINTILKLKTEAADTPPGFESRKTKTATSPISTLAKARASLKTP